MADTAQNAEAFDFKLYRYDPSLPAAVVSVVIFAILTVAHTWRLFRVRAYYFTAFTIGGICRFTLHGVIIQAFELINSSRNCWLCR